MEQQLRNLICEIGKLLYDKNLVVANDGNISVRFGGGFLCTPTGVSKGLMTPDMIIRLDASGRQVDDINGSTNASGGSGKIEGCANSCGGSGKIEGSTSTRGGGGNIESITNACGGSEIKYKVSSEFKMHLRVYEKRPDVNSVVHAHPPYATTYAIAREPLNRPITAEAIVALGEVPVAAYGTPSTTEIPDNIEPLLADYNAMLLANHGALTYGRDLRQAYMRMETVEFYAREMFQTELLGRAVELGENELQKLSKLRKPY